MANENYDELQIQKELRFAKAEITAMAAEYDLKLAHAEQRIAALREALGYYERAESVTFPAVNQGDPHGSCECGHPENHAYASGYLMGFMRTTDFRKVAQEALHRDDEAAKK